MSMGEGGEGNVRVVSGCSWRANRRSPALVVHQKWGNGAVTSIKMN